MQSQVTGVVVRIVAAGVVLFGCAARLTANQVLTNGDFGGGSTSLDNYPPLDAFAGSASQSNITFSILWMTKWDAYMDLAAVDNVALDLSTNGPTPPGSDKFTAKDSPTWTQPDPTWHPATPLLDWARAGAVSGGAQFAAPQECTVGLYPASAATGDLNGDGLPDLVVASLKGHLVSVFLQQPGGLQSSYSRSRK